MHRAFPLKLTLTVVAVRLLPLSFSAVLCAWVIPSSWAIRSVVYVVCWTNSVRTWKKRVHPAQYRSRVSTVSQALAITCWSSRMTALRVKLLHNAMRVSVLHCRLSPASAFPLRIWIQYLRRPRLSTSSSRVTTAVLLKRWKMHFLISRSTTRYSSTSSTAVLVLLPRPTSRWLRHPTLSLLLSTFVQKARQPKRPTLKALTFATTPLSTVLSKKLSRHSRACSSQSTKSATPVKQRSVHCSSLLRLVPSPVVWLPKARSSETARFVLSATATSLSPMPRSSPCVMKRMTQMKSTLVTSAVWFCPTQKSRLATSSRRTKKSKFHVPNPGMSYTS